MSVTLTVADGKPCVEITDAAGECWTYTLEVLGPNAWRLTKRPEGEPHVQRCHGPARWSCTCKDWQFKNRAHRNRPAGAPCKHICAVRSYLDVMAAFQKIAEIPDKQAVLG